jgi:autophagy-related protein 16
VWDLGKGYCVRTVFCYSPCNAVAVVGESTRMLCSAHADRRIRLWDLKTADPVAEIQDVQSKQATSLSWSPAWEYLVLTTAPDNTAQLIDLRNQKSAHTFRVRARAFMFVPYSFSHHCAHAHNTHTQQPPQGGVLSPQACFSADGNFVAAGSTSGGVYIWNTHTAALEAHITEGHQYAPSSLISSLRSHVHVHA